MTQVTQAIVTSIICVLFFHITFSTGLYTTDKNDNFECGRRNALRTDCATSCDVDRCPVAEHYSRVCDYHQCAPGCQCRFNEKFAANRSCIPTLECPPFQCDRQYEEYAACPPYSTDSCAQGSPFGFILMIVECFPACRCQMGFCRKDGVCVHEDK